MPVVLDPVMVAKGGASLISDEATGALIELLLPLATVVTPNTPELVVLTETEVEDEADALLAAQELLNQGPQAVLAKGGHLPGMRITDWLVTRGMQRAFTSERIETNSSHGTGCTLASALACGLGQGLPLETRGGAGAGVCRAGAAQCAGVRRGAWAAGVPAASNDRRVRLGAALRRGRRRRRRGRARAAGRGRWWRRR